VEERGDRPRPRYPCWGRLAPVAENLVQKLEVLEESLPVSEAEPREGTPGETVPRLGDDVGGRDAEALVSVRRSLAVVADVEGMPGSHCVRVASLDGVVHRPRYLEAACDDCPGLPILVVR
jgi:hypothetical protein